jgi:hypothetical protein
MYAPSTKHTFKAWVNFNSDGTINDDFNISTVTKNSTGNFTITFEYALSNSNYCVSVIPKDDAGAMIVSSITSQSTSSFTVQLRGGNEVILGISLMTTTPIDSTDGVVITVCGSN